MKRRSRTAWTGLFFFFSLAFGCADKPEALRVEGNVVSVTGAPAPQAASPAFIDFASRIAGRMSNLWAAPAIAQSSCGAAVEGVLACLATEGPAGRFAATCSRVRSNCEFVVTIGLDSPGDTLNLFFCADANGDGECAPEETSAPYVNFDKVGNFCNGDVLRVNDVAIDFGSQTCTGSPTSIVADGCAPPDPTAAAATRTAAPNNTPGPGDTPEPGQTPATPVPTVTQNPQATATLPPPTPTRTRTSPPVFASPTPTPACGQENDACNQDAACCGELTCFAGNCTPCLETGEQGCSDGVACCDDADVCNGDTCAGCVDTGNEQCSSSGDCCSANAACQGGDCCIQTGLTGCTAPSECCSGNATCIGNGCCIQPGLTGCTTDDDCCQNEGLQVCDSGQCLTPG